VYQQATISGNSQSFILEIHGSGLSPAGDSPRVLVFPSNSPEAQPKILSNAADGTLLTAEFSASVSYVLQEVSLSFATASPSKTIDGATCRIGDRVTSEYSFVPQDQVKNKYGNGVAKNFHVIQLSIVNRCPMSIIVPLAGIAISPRLGTSGATKSDGGNSGAEVTKGGGVANDDQLSGSGIAHGAYLAKNAVSGATSKSCIPGRMCIVPYSLDHVTSVYSTDRKLTGARAIFFNSLLAAGTLGSAIQPFFGPGFTQAVAIWGGGFTNAAQTVFKDMSAEQLQNITSQSFGTAEQIGPGGSMSKYLFVPKINGRSAEAALQKAIKRSAGSPDAQHALQSALSSLQVRSAEAEAALQTGDVNVGFSIIPALTTSETTASPKQE
jgi:hypothetical protein